jgi:hypothetical protein
MPCGVGPFKGREAREDSRYFGYYFQGPGSPAAQIQPSLGAVMSKERNTKKETKKTPAKSMKEKRLEKREKKAGKKA